MKEFIEAQTNKVEFSKRAGISLVTVYKILTGNSLEARTIGKLLQVSGFEFEKAFEVKK